METLVKISLWRLREIESIVQNEWLRFAGTGNLPPHWIDYPRRTLYLFSDWLGIDWEEFQCYTSLLSLCQRFAGGFITSESPTIAQLAEQTGIPLERFEPWFKTRVALYRRLCRVTTVGFEPLSESPSQVNSASDQAEGNKEFLDVFIDPYGDYDPIWSGYE